MPRRALTVVLALAAVASLSACGSRGISVSKSDPTSEGARLFAERCSGCHTLDKVGAEGSATKVRDRERVDGPNFNTRKEQVNQVLYAIRNGGFSGAIMPENIVVGKESQAGAQVLAEEDGTQGPTSVSPNGCPATVLDLRAIRRDPEAVKSALARRSPDLAARIDELLAADEVWRAATAAAESLRAEQKQASEAIGAAKARGEDAADALARVKELSATVKERVEEARAAEERLQAILVTLPNLPDPSAPDEDTTIREVGEAGREGKDHLDLAGERIDMERGARLSGSRFAYLRGDIALLELALVRWATEKLIGHGFEPVLPPVLVREEALYGTGFLPDTEQQIYRLPEDDLYLVGTSEVALASMHAGEILESGDLPRRYAGFSSCFRREAGAAGKDTRGIFRVHQFDKLEMFSFVHPGAGLEEHERLLAIEEEILGELEVPYRVVNIAVNDLGAAAAKKYDCEAWMPGQGRYREVTSTSNTTDYQARRLDVRERPAGGGKPEIVHTLNGTAVAGRHMIALLENGQRDDGTIAMPAALHTYGVPAVLQSAAS